MVFVAVLIMVFITVVLAIVYLRYFSTSRYRFRYLSKISGLTSIKFSVLEQNRQTYYPANPECQCHPNHASIIVPQTNCPHRSETLFISFAGAALLVGGFTFTEWKSTIKQLDSQADILFLTDPAQSFFLQDSTYSWQGLSYCRSLVRNYSKLYRNVVLIGASMGASMVCMCSDLATLSIAFNPIFDPSLVANAYYFYRVLWKYPKAHILKQVQINIDKITNENLPSILHVHWSKNSHNDLIQANFISNLSFIHFTDVNECTKKQGAYFWLHKCDSHGLPQYLKNEGILTDILRCHVSA
ncbi:unnamed protein product [Adineta ricciae]|uniref:Uncharacterized protein n=1 Tax=Adineta ricciae TaxID=249248 RepID=A0A814HQJ1_ADIRI|nr:unnamed protein product [Adineta ricciae]CAF1399522.1 unnamed protein product [Adineta ricciae]